MTPVGSCDGFPRSRFRCRTCADSTRYFLTEEKIMAQKETSLLLRSNLKALRLPTMLAEHAKLAGEAADSNQDYLEYLPRLTELELATRSANALQARTTQAGFPVPK